MLAQQADVGSMVAIVAAAAVVLGVIQALVQLGDRLWRGRSRANADDQNQGCSADHDELKTAMASLTLAVSQLTNVIKADHEVEKMRYETLIREIGQLLEKRRP